MIYTIIKKHNWQIASSEVQESILHFEYKIQQALYGYAKETTAQHTHPFFPNDEHDHYVFIIGGDGTMINQGKSFLSNHLNALPDYQIVGINAGTIGFLTPYEHVALDKLLANLQAVASKGPRFKPNDTLCESRAVIEYVGCSINPNEQINWYPTTEPAKRFAINEYVITGNSGMSLIEFELCVRYSNDYKELSLGTFKAKSLVLSTPTGSTAFAGNIGGPIINPNGRLMQITLLAPINVENRPLIIDDNTTVFVRLISNNAHLYSDGQDIGALEADTKHVFEISSTYDLRTLTPADWNFYANVSQKLNWKKEIIK